MAAGVVRGDRNGESPIYRLPKDPVDTTPLHRMSPTPGLPGPFVQSSGEDKHQYWGLQLSKDEEGKHVFLSGQMHVSRLQFRN